MCRLSVSAPSHVRAVLSGHRSGEGCDSDVIMEQDTTDPSSKLTLTSSTDVLTTESSSDDDETSSSSSSPAVSRTKPTFSFPFPAQERSRPEVRVQVESISVGDGGTGVLLGDQTSLTYNQYIGVGGQGSMDQETVRELLSDAVKISSETKRQFFNHTRTRACHHGVGMPGSAQELGQTCSCWVMTTLLIGLIPLVSTTLISTLTSPRPSPRTLPPDITPRRPVVDNRESGGRTVKQYTGEDITNFSEAPRIFPRIFWCARPPTEGLIRMVRPVSRVVVCHTTTEVSDTIPDCIKNVRYIQQFHMDCRGWSDIGYSFLIGGDGNVFEGRGWDIQAAHTKGQNVGTLAVGFLGTFHRQMPKPGMIEAFHKLVAVGVKGGKIAEDYAVVAQCQLTATSSPGLPLVREMSSWPRFDHSLPVRCPAVGDIEV